MPMEFGFGRIFPKICEIFRGGEPKNGKKAGFRGKKGVKKAFFSKEIGQKCNFISLSINKITKKMQKSKKKCVACDACNGKILFLQSQTTTTGEALREGLSTGECSLKEWKNVANTQEEEFEIRKRWGQDRQTKKKRLIIMESSILAQDERWRQA